MCKLLERRRVTWGDLNPPVGSVSCRNYVCWLVEEIYCLLILWSILQWRTSTVYSGPVMYLRHSWLSKDPVQGLLNSRYNNRYSECPMLWHLRRFVWTFSISTSSDKQKSELQIRIVAKHLKRSPVKWRLWHEILEGELSKNRWVEKNWF